MPLFGRNKEQYSIKDRKLRDAIKRDLYVKDDDLNSYRLIKSYSSEFGDKTARRDFDVIGPDGRTHVFREFSDLQYYVYVKPK